MARNLMGYSRPWNFVVTTILVLMVVPGNSFAAAKPTKDKGGWTKVQVSEIARGRGFTTTLTKSGHVLVVGGYLNNEYISAAQMFEPDTGKWRAVGPTIESRRDHTATVLPNGQVLVIGGYGKDGPVGLTELYDPAVGDWISAGSIPARHGHTATLLSDGRVLVVGGSELRHGPYFTDVWIYDPDTGQWAQTGLIEQPRSAHTATLLRDGRVLVVGGRAAAHGLGLREAALFDPKTGTWSRPAHFPLNNRGEHTGVRLKDGRVLIAGGMKFPGAKQTSLQAKQAIRNAEIYDSDTQEFSPIKARHAPRHFPESWLLQDGRVFMWGGFAYPGKIDTFSDSIAFDDNGPPQLFDPKSRTWSNARVIPEKLPKVSSLLSAAQFKATLLTGKFCRPHCGKVLMIGGGNKSRAFLFDPVAPRASAGDAKSGFGKSAIWVVAAGAVLGLAGGFWILRRKSGRFQAALPE